ncbi:MAG: FumA C-terminus/TtdB family hydratase beta subunit [Candidatus Omnitrophica bacterium]|nr:FumA C-terminus/TtdB family hydratase beta subunit [Candidatus Omnitrophota bacterium]
MSAIKLRTPITSQAAMSLKAGDEVLLSGVILTARDAAHKRLHDLIVRGKPVPLNLKDAVIYYAGPTPPRPGRAIGSCGPTTSSRMDPFTPELLKMGLGGMIGKGDRSAEVRKAIKKYKRVYFLATGGIGALLSTKVKAAKAILFKDLGPEAIYKMEVADFPLIVGIDPKGNDIYDKAKRKSV